ncbi:hypothetical protein D3C78_1823290 [compost metagenome]
MTSGTKIAVHCKNPLKIRKASNSTTRLTAAWNRATQMLTAGSTSTGNTTFFT